MATEPGDTEIPLLTQILAAIEAGGGGGGGAPSGPAGGALGGTYPNPTVLKVGSGSTTVSAAGEAMAGAADAAAQAALLPPPEWGDIGGTLADQTDLQASLDAKSQKATQIWTWEAGGGTPSGNGIFTANNADPLSTVTLIFKGTLLGPDYTGPGNILVMIGQNGLTLYYKISAITTDNANSTYTVEFEGDLGTPVNWSGSYGLNFIPRGLAIIEDTGWTANASAGDKTAVVPDYAAEDFTTIDGGAFNAAFPGAAAALSTLSTALSLTRKKVQAQETALVANLLPNA